MDTKLATIVCSDVVGYSKAIQLDEEGTLHRLYECRSIIDQLIDQFKGRLFNTGGDSVLIEFSSAVEAIRFGIEMQLEMRKLNNGLRWRIGMHVGEVFVKGNDLLGDTVNLAARTESMADYGGVTVTDDVYRLVSGKIKNIQFVSRGKQEFKNVEPMEIWSVAIVGAEPNPKLANGNVSATRQEPVAQKTQQEMIDTVINDVHAKNKSIDDAQAFRRDGKFGPATRIFMWRITKSDFTALDELINLGIKNLIPVELKPYALAIIKGYCTKIDSDLALKLVDLLETGYFGPNRSLSLAILKNTSKISEEAHCKFASMVAEDPASTESEVNEAISDLKSLAMKQQVPAMVKLGEIYLKVGDKKNAFRWLYVARAHFSPYAQELLEHLNHSLNKTDFNTYKYDADALVDEIKFIAENRLR